MIKLPYWFKQDIPDEVTLKMSAFLSSLGIHTVCQEAHCPNVSVCFKKRSATFMILGNVCTRNCRFCAVDKSRNIKELVLDEDEPTRVARAVSELGLHYVVITSVARDDLKDSGAKIFVKTIKLIKDIDENIKIEVLIPDLQGNVSSLKCVVDARPDIIAHNIETIERLYPVLRPLADYSLSLRVLKNIKELNPSLITKSSLMLGLGENEEEIVETLQDLRNNYCDILTLGQYLAPSVAHYPVKEFIGPAQFQRYESIAKELGFKGVFSGPLVRSSYCAEEVYQEAIHA